MSSLKEKAKTLKQIYEWISRQQIAINRAEPTYETDKQYFEEILQEKWVRLEDAEKEVSKAQEDYAKQLQQLQELFPKIQGCFLYKEEQAFLYLQLAELKKKFEELLKNVEELNKFIEQYLAYFQKFLSKKLFLDKPIHFRVYLYQLLPPSSMGCAWNTSDAVYTIFLVSWVNWNIIVFYELPNFLWSPIQYWMDFK